jgi:large subunit ribosomal protein L17
MLANMACSLIEHKRINTTVAKAKALKQFVEPLITKSKLIRLITVVFVSLLRSKYAVTDLFRDVAAKLEIVQVDTHVSLKLEIVWEIMLIWQ